MEKMDTLRAKYLEVTLLYRSASGAAASYYEGKMVGITDAVAEILNIPWLDAQMKLQGH